MKSRHTVLLATALMAIGAPVQAFAQTQYSLVPTAPVDLTAGGLGNRATVLTIQNRGTESGCVGKGGSTLQSVCGYADNVVKNGNSQTQLQPISTATGYTGSNFRLFLNFTEPGSANSADLTSATATFFSGSGSNATTLFSAFIANQHYDTTLSGLGGFGFPFMLDAAGQTALQNALAGGNTIFVGVGAELTGVSGGNETFNIAQVSGSPVPSTVPEPSSMALLGTGLVGLVPMVRRKIKK